MEETNFSAFLAARLKEERMTLRKLSDTTGITMKHLEALLAGDRKSLPAAPYLRGYLVRLGGVLDFDPDYWWSRLRVTQAPITSGERDALPRNRFGRESRRAALWIGIVILIVLVYGIARFDAIFGIPRLSVSFPPDGITVSAPSVTITGVVRNGSTVKINGETVALADDGSFEQDAALSPGPNRFEIRAEKFLGRSATTERTVTYEPFVIEPGATTTLGTTSTIDFLPLPPEEPTSTLP